ncbi:MAG: hypothetical protein DWQ07_25785 [Chloroflexi bacterium]|nr:MAG: hypothetical protein DWQ07_25785 [Chloroflexota bacterium]
MTAIGVENVDALPSELDKAIAIINLTPNPNYFQNNINQDESYYMKWWHEIGRPTSGRGLARLALFSSLIDGFSTSPLHSTIIKKPRTYSIKTTYVVTTLSDTVGTAIMWDVLNLLKRNSVEDQKNLSVLWLALAGEDSSSNSQPYAWQEMHRLGNGGYVDAQYSQFDWQLNQGHINSGASRIIIVGNPQEEMNRLEDASDSSDLTANVVSSTLDPTFHRFFLGEWLPSSLRRDNLSLNASSMGEISFYVPSNMIRELCVWRLIKDLLWDGITPNSIGLFGSASKTQKHYRNLALNFLRDLPQSAEIFGATVFMSEHQHTSISVQKDLSEEAVHTYKEYLIYYLYQILNGSDIERDRLRLSLSGKLAKALGFMRELNIIWGQISQNEEFPPGIQNESGHSLKTIRDFTQASFEKLEAWGKTLNSDSSIESRNHLKSLVENSLKMSREQLQNTYLNKDSYRIPLYFHGNYRKMEDTIYEQWRSYLTGREQPGRKDPLSNLLGHFGWNFRLAESGDAVEVELCLVNNEEKDIDKFAYKANQQTEIHDALRSLVFRYTGFILDGDELNMALEHQFHAGEFYDAVRKYGSPLMRKGATPNSLNIIGADESLLNTAKEFLSAFGSSSTMHMSKSINPHKFSLVSIRDRIETDQIIRFPVRTPRKAEFIFSAEQAFHDLEAKIRSKSTRKPLKLSRDFAYLLSDPNLAEYYGYGILVGFISFQGNKIICKHETGNLIIGNRSQSVLHYGDHPLLAAMEDFVIMQPGSAEIAHPLHPKNRKKSFGYWDDYIQRITNQVGFDKKLEANMETIETKNDNVNRYKEVSITFFAWLSILHDNLLIK